MTDAPAVSVIMANYNGAQRLEEAVLSVQRQSLVDWELILVDDASTDDSVSIVRAMAERDPRIRLLVQPENRGPAAARNRALEAARGAWIAVVDSDDVMLPVRLERLLLRAQAHGARIVADNQMICSADLTPSGRFMDPAQAVRLGRVGLAAFIDSSRLYATLPDLGFLKPLIRADLIHGTGARYDESLRIGEDFHFLVSLLSFRAGLYLEPEPLYLYRKHGGSISHRMAPAVIATMIEADRRVRDRLRASPVQTESSEAARAMTRRIEGLRSWAVYERVMASAKAGRWIEAAILALGRPHAWRLMSRPIRRRLARRWRPLARRRPNARAVEISAGNGV